MNTTSSYPRLLRWPELKTLLNGTISRTSIWRLEQQGQFPQRVNLGVNAVAWYEEEVLEWLAARPRGPLSERQTNASQNASQR